MYVLYFGYFLTVQLCDLFDLEIAHPRAFAVKSREMCNVLNSIGLHIESRMWPMGIDSNRPTLLKSISVG